MTTQAGLPPDVPGLGVITPDFNEDGWPDILISQANRLFLSKGEGKYDEAGSHFFQYEPINREASPCGVAFGDLNKDGQFDIVIVDHSQPARLHLYLNLGLRNGVPEFREITKEAGLAYQFPSWTPEGFHLKHAHVEIGDFDNDTWPDILVAATYQDDGKVLPFICWNRSGTSSSKEKSQADKLRFQVPPVTKANAHFPAGPVCDFDRDGRLDVFLASWQPEIPSRLFLNRLPARHWLQVQVRGKTINRTGIGTKIKVYVAGNLGKEDALIGYQEIGTGFGYCSGQETRSHFGLGDAAQCDLEIIFPFGKGSLHKKAVEADQLLIVKEP